MTFSGGCSVAEDVVLESPKLSIAALSVRLVTVTESSLLTVTRVGAVRSKFE